MIGIAGPVRPSEGTCFPPRTRCVGCSATRAWRSISASTTKTGIWCGRCAPRGRNTDVGLKFFNVYGPREDHKGEMRSVVHKAFGQIRETGEVALFKSYLARYRDGEQIRDFVFVADAVKVALFFLDQPEAGGLFNCGTGQGRTWLDLARAVFAAMGREPRVRFIEMPEDLRSRYQYHTAADTRKLRAAGYTEPFTPLEAGVREYVQSYLSAKAGLEVRRRG